MTPRVCRRRGRSTWARRGIRCAVLSLLVATAWTSGGCAVLAGTVGAAESTKVKAVHSIANRPTLVIVDDPRRQFQNAALPGQIAESIGFELRNNKVVSRVIAQEDLMRLAEQRGDAYQTMSLDDVGRTLGAEQVIHVHVVQMRLAREPGILRPSAFVRVKLWDVQQGKRLFPGDDVDSPSATGGAAGYELPVEMRYPHNEYEGPGAEEMLYRQFATYIGARVADLFYKHTDRQVGRLYDDMREGK